MGRDSHGERLGWVGLDNDALGRDLDKLAQEGRQLTVPMADLGPDDIAELILIVSGDGDFEGERRNSRNHKHEPALDRRLADTVTGADGDEPLAPLDLRRTSLSCHSCGSTRRASRTNFDGLSAHSSDFCCQSGLGWIVTLSSPRTHRDRSFEGGAEAHVYKVLLASLNDEAVKLGFAQGRGDGGARLLLLHRRGASFL